jgi:hypothetical protein
LRLVIKRPHLSAVSIFKDRADRSAALARRKKPRSAEKADYEESIFACQIAS